MIDFERLDQIKARCKGATPGPWRSVAIRESDDHVTEIHRLQMPARDVIIDPYTVYDDNADFIANAREDVPWLLEQLKIGSDVYDALNEQLEFYVANCDALLKLIMTKTDLCPFGGSESGKRKGCRFGHPGCACMDWFMAHEDEVEEEE